MINLPKSSSIDSRHWKSICSSLLSVEVRASNEERGGNNLLQEIIMVYCDRFDSNCWWCAFKPHLNRNNGKPHQIKGQHALKCTLLCALFLTLYRYTQLLDRFQIHYSLLLGCRFYYFYWWWTGIISNNIIKLLEILL